MGRRNGVRPIIGSPFQCHGLEPLEQRCLASGTPGMDIAPVVTTSAGSAEYTEDGEPMVIDPGLTVSDPDSMIAGATVRIGVNYMPSEDSLVFADQLGITGSWNSMTGLLTLTGTAPVADYQTALRSVAYLNSSNNPSDSLRTVAFAVNDGLLDSAARTRTVIVTPMDDAPVTTPSGGTAAFVEDGGPVVVDAGLVVSDIDSAEFWGALVQITGNYAPAEDSLLFTDQLGITGSWDESSGTLMLIGIATVADYQTALRSVQYLNSSQDPSTLTRTVSVQVSDGALPSPDGACPVSVTAANEAPVVIASAGGTEYAEDEAPVPIDAGLRLSDVDSPMIASATLAITGNYLPAEDSLVFADQPGITGSWDAVAGTLTLSGTATAGQYEAALQSVGYVNLSQDPSGLIRTVTITVSDGTDASEPVSRAVSVTPVNDAPVAVSSSGSATYSAGGAAVPVDGGVALSDVDSPVLSSAVVRISGNFAAAEDSLVFNAQDGITGVWQASSATLTLSGAASVAAYQDALRNVEYLNTSSDPSVVERTVTIVVVDDAGAASTPVSRAIEVVATTPPPPTQPPPPTLPCPPRRPVTPPCHHAHPAPPVARPSHAPHAGHGPAGRFDIPKVTIHVADITHAGGPASRIVVEAPNEWRQDPVLDVLSSAVSSSRASSHAHADNGGKHAAGESRILDNRINDDDRRGPFLSR